MRIAVVGRKGGTGKSTVAIYTLFKLKEMKYRVWLEDFSVSKTSSEYLKKVGFRGDPKPKFTILDSPPSDVQRDLTILVSEPQVLWMEKDNADVLVLNKVSPLPDRFMEEVKLAQANVGRFKQVFMVPFSGALFSGELTTEPSLDRVVMGILGQEKGSLILPMESFHNV
ncbi:hypothetical protein GWK48_09720 [Metallosphaera tengchongensis]|uniref:CobQ/CobB/MinD/ParA nucleotide binding domain-containing protein n=1 Tax=Metallosphaera tengchongensis TaxID=1532350 RepID=A0A6N0NV68_9CREN|nr:hypothetical protein [Metallosphaera tengchongensis]QKR00622.1 hypothetical protein GWK48_09720 [Metallosphaera tengchongensis]